MNNLKLDTMNLNLLNDDVLDDEEFKIIQETELPTQDLNNLPQIDEIDDGDGDDDEPGSEYNNSPIIVPSPAPQPPPKKQQEAFSDVSSYVGSDLTPHQQETKKKNLLYKLKRYQKKGFALSRNFNLDSNLIDLKAEVDSIKREANLGCTVSTMKNGLGVLTYLIEMLNNRFDPLNAKLNGWSNQIKNDLETGDYDEVFEELYDKYTDRFSMPPEMRLISMLGTSAIQYHIAQVVINHTLNPNKTEQILRENPKLKEDILNAVNENKQETKINNKKMKQKQMTDPSDIDNILKELQIKDETSKMR